MISDSERNTLIQYRINQSKQTKIEADFLITNKMYNASMNRIYYSMFYIILALGLKYQFETSKHQQLIGWFTKTFIKTNLLNRKYGKLLQETYDFRQRGDYEPFLEFSFEDVTNKFAQLEEFLVIIEDFILKE